MDGRYRPGAIVHARGREWIVLPEREAGVLRLRPLTMAQGNEVGLFLPLEGDRVRPARFADPEPVSGGDATGIITLFDAARLSLRSSAGPFRSLGRISVIPRPYQFVPLIMALFRAVEVAVRKGGAFREDELGVKLMRDAFNPDRGPLTDMTVVSTKEREAVANLFAGAIGAAKNPASHREVEMDRNEAVRLILFASYLMSIVDARTVR
jgi:hypothetical protein